MSGRKAKPVGAPTAFSKRYFEIPRREIAYLRFILESYDGLAYVRTIDAGRGLVEIAFPQERRGDVATLLAALTDETGMRTVGAPENLSPL